MARTPSNMLPLGTLAPDFTLPNTTAAGEMLTLSDQPMSPATVVMFICNHCPFVILVNEELVRLADEYQKKGVLFFAISSNDVVNYPQDSPEKMTEHAAEVGYPFPYLYDETQDVAKAYDAACTPDFYLFDDMMKLVYRGQLDDARPGNGKDVTGVDLRAALDAVLAEEEVNEEQKPSIGCNIKWK